MKLSGCQFFENQRKNFGSNLVPKSLSSSNLKFSDKKTTKTACSLKKKATGYLSIARAGQFRDLKGAKSPL